MNKWIKRNQRLKKENNWKEKRIGGNKWRNSEKKEEKAI